MSASPSGDEGEGDWLTLAAQRIAGGERAADGAVVAHFLPGAGRFQSGRLPMKDHNTRIVVFGKTPEQAKAVAEAIAQEAFHNVSYFGADFEQFRSAVQR